MSTSLILPDLALLDAAAAELLHSATPSQERAINKALWQLQGGLEIRPTCGGFLIPSGTRAGVIHRVSTVHGCNCQAALKGHVCWHAWSIRIVEQAQIHAPSPARVLHLGERLAAARATTELNELFAA